MKAKNKSYDLTEVRFRVLKGSKEYEAVTFFEKNYNCNTRSKTVQQVLMNLKVLFDFFNVRTFEGLIKKIGIMVRSDIKPT